MVLYTSRGLGIARSLMQAVETTAASRRLSLLFLDTSEGLGGACGFYRKLGYAYAGGIPGYALDPDGTPAANAIFYKRL
jgi:ribosomal protein S18 acetylase RimI-like enzyme